MKKLSFIFFFLLLFTHVYAKENIRFGVFAYKGVEDTKKQYQSLVNYLNEKLDNRVILEVLTQEEMNEKIKNRQLDIVTTNPIHFLHIRQQYDLSGAIATLRGFNKGVVTSKLAGVIVVRKDSPLQTLEDLKNKIIVAPSKKHMGGFRAQAYELHLKGINIEEKSKSVIELKGTHQDVVRAILNKEADVGFIRDGILEEMTAKGELENNTIKIINEQNNPYHPYKISTKLYPEWPVFSMPYMNEDDVKIFISALFSIKPTESMKNAGIYDYTLPADYLQTEELSRALRLPPFDKVENVTIVDILQQYKAVFIATFISLLLGLFYHIREKKGKDLLSSLLSNMGEGVYGIDKDGNCTWINKKALEMLGYSEKEVLHKDQHLLFHHHKPTGREYEIDECPIYLTAKDKIIQKFR